MRVVLIIAPYILCARLRLLLRRNINTTEPIVNELLMFFIKVRRFLDYQAGQGESKDGRDVYRSPIDAFFLGAPVGVHVLTWLLRGMTAGAFSGSTHRFH